MVSHPAMIKDESGAGKIQSSQKSITPIKGNKPHEQREQIRETVAFNENKKDKKKSKKVKP